MKKIIIAVLTMIILGSFFAFAACDNIISSGKEGVKQQKITVEDLYMPFFTETQWNTKRETLSNDYPFLTEGYIFGYILTTYGFETDNIWINGQKASFIKESKYEYIDLQTGTYIIKKETNEYKCEFSMIISQLQSDNSINYLTSSNEAYAYSAKSKMNGIQLNVDKFNSLSVTKIYPYAFADIEFNRVSISTSVKSIGDFAFFSCADLSLINLSNGLETIGNSAFALCISLTSISIPHTTKSIGNEAFYGCVFLERIMIFRRSSADGNITKIGKNSFVLCSPEINIYDRAYFTAPNWSDFRTLMFLRYFAN